MLWNMSQLIFPMLFGTSDVDVNPLHIRGGNTFTVNVGQGGVQAFSPHSIQASIGDTVKFIFYPGPQAYSVTHGPFAEPCQSWDFSFYSGPIKPEQGKMAEFSFKVTTEDEIWFYSAEGKQCHYGMVGVINNRGSSYETYSFQAFAAKGVTHPLNPQNGDWDPPLGEVPAPPASASASVSTVVGTAKPDPPKTTYVPPVTTSSSAIVAVSTVTLETSFETVVTRVTSTRWQLSIGTLPTTGTTTAAASATSTGTPDKLGSAAKSGGGHFSQTLNAVLAIGIVGVVMTFLMA